MKIQTNNPIIIGTASTKLRTHFLVLGLLALGLLLGGKVGRLNPSVQAKTMAGTAAAVNLTPEQMESAVEEYFDSIGERVLGFGGVFGGLQS